MAVKRTAKTVDPFSMTLKLWQVALATAAGLFAAIFLFSDLTGLGLALLAADLLWLVTRIEILENHDEPAHYTTLRGQLGILKLALLLGLNAAAIYAIVFIENDFGPRAQGTVVADFAIIGLCFMLLTELWRCADETRKWFVGARAEREVGEKLVVFKDRGWLLLHGYKRDNWGDIDHILCGPRGAYAIETKSYGYRASDVVQATRNAVWLHEKLHVPFVTGVLCVNDDRPPFKKDKVWVVSHRDLVGWLEAQPEKPIDPEYARACLLPPPDPGRGWRSGLRSQTAR
jgi:hypothetical protein